LVLCYDDHTLLSNYVDHHPFIISQMINSGYSPMKYSYSTTLYQSFSIFKN